MIQKIVIFILYFIISFVPNSWADSNWGTLIWGQDNWYIDVILGDVNNDRAVDLADTILALKAVSNLNPQPIHKEADINDGKIGLEEAVYTLQVTAEKRP
jgi:hypothetical protein